ncbi:uncharacterized protein EI97DRAFT_446655 [Westerdykella ornata]|uniref:Uncharacterized protein n=1 Tax=Westerdykella ornata TaxID=318751 RepID=A0A6A6J5Z3_WESOR|nr:uncharacterized protein EI97DRAFT_446655 [Westerdykella ornata]KAF2271388.1 hypothetical protein EI97DRAFT_446655 [Westerdykella ornata]
MEQQYHSRNKPSTTSSFLPTPPPSPPYFSPPPPTMSPLQMHVAKLETLQPYMNHFLNMAYHGYNTKDEPSFLSACTSISTILFEEGAGHALQSVCEFLTTSNQDLNQITNPGGLGWDWAIYRWLLCFLVNQGQSLPGELARLREALGQLAVSMGNPLESILAAAEMLAASERPVESAPVPRECNIGKPLEVQAGPVPLVVDHEPPRVPVAAAHVDSVPSLEASGEKCSGSSKGSEDGGPGWVDKLSKEELERVEEEMKEAAARLDEIPFDPEFDA